MTEFSFITVWQIDAPLEPVWDALLRIEDWPSWWRGVVKVDVLSRGDANHVGFSSRQVWKSRLPYSLNFQGSITNVVPMSRIDIVSEGQLAGTGLMRFAHEGKRTTFQYNWNVTTTRAWMNLFAPILKPAFSWNHDIIMDWGAEGLARKLGGAKVETSDKGVF